MKLSEFIQRLDDEHVIKIGAEGGNAFFFIGTKDTLIKNISEYDKVIQEAIKEKKKDYYSRAHSLEKRLEQSKKEFAECRALLDKEGNDMTRFKKMQTSRKLNAAEKRINTLPDEIDKAYEKADRSNEAIQLYREIVSDLKDRTVTEALGASRIIEPKPTIIVYIKGCENGTWWDTSESGGESFSVSGFNLNRIQASIEEGII